MHAVARHMRTVIETHFFVGSILNRNTASLHMLAGKSSVLDGRYSNNGLSRVAYPSGGRPLRVHLNKATVVGSTPAPSA